MTARERFEEWVLSVDWTDYGYNESPSLNAVESETEVHYYDPMTAALYSAWQNGSNETQKEFWPPRPTALPSGWKVKGDEPRLVRPGEEFSPTTYFGFNPDEIKLKDPISKYTVPIFVWELEREVVK